MVPESHPTWTVPLRGVHKTTLPSALPSNGLSMWTVHVVRPSNGRNVQIWAHASSGMSGESLRLVAYLAVLPTPAHARGQVEPPYASDFSGRFMSAARNTLNFFGSNGLLKMSLTLKSAPIFFDGHAAVLDALAQEVVPPLDVLGVMSRW